MAAARAVNTQTAVSTPPDVRGQIVKLVGDFVRRDVLPVASRYDKEDIYPAELVETMREMGLFGITIPERYGGLGLDYTTFAMVFEELSKGWMSVSGVIGTHHLMAYVIASFGTEDQKLRFLPRMASGELKGGLALTESEAGSDVQNIQTRARRDGEEYVLDGSKMFITNAVRGDAFAVLAKTDPDAEPAYRGMSCFVVEKPAAGLSVGRQLDKLGVSRPGYRGALLPGVPHPHREPRGGRGGVGLPARHERARDGSNQHRGPRRGRCDGRFRGGYRVRSAAGGVWCPHSPAPGHPDEAGRYGHQDPRRPAADL